MTTSFARSSSSLDLTHIILHELKSPSALQVRVAENPSEKENKLFVGMLPRSVDEQVLYQLFIVYGELREVHVIKLPDGTSRGCAFVKYVQRNAALAAIEGLHEAIPPVIIQLYQ